MSLEIEKIAELSRLSLKPEEKKKLQKDLNAILAYVEKLKEVETGHVEASSHILNVENVFRSDRLESWDVREEVLRHAPARHEVFFKVPREVEKE